MIQAELYTPLQAKEKRIRQQSVEKFPNWSAQSSRAAADFTSI